MGTLLERNQGKSVLDEVLEEGAFLVDPVPKNCITQSYHPERSAAKLKDPRLLLLCSVSTP
jgi:hypothetical protein